MPFNIPSLRRLIRDGERDIATELDVPSLPPFSVEKAVNVAVSSQLRDVYDHQMWLKDQIIPTPKSDDATIIETATYEGVIRKQPTFATGPAVFTGTTALPVGTEMQSDDRIVYHVTASSAPVDGVITVLVQATETGFSGNLADSERLTLLSPVAGVNSEGVAGTGGIWGGTDIEPVSELLDRLLFRKRNPPTGGALHDYIIWAREVPGVSRAWAWDCWHGVGTVGLAWVYDDRPTGIIPTAADIAAMEAWIFRHPDPATGVDVGKPGGIEVWVMPLTSKPVNMGIRLTPDNSATRAAVRANLDVLFKHLSPGQTLLISALRTAIGTSAGVEDYTLSITADIPAATQELITLGIISWLTA